MNTVMVKKNQVGLTAGLREQDCSFV